MQDSTELGLPSALRIGQRLQTDSQMIGPRSRRNMFSNRCIERYQSNGVLLRYEQIGQTRRKSYRIVVLGHLLGTRPAIVHRTALIDDQGRSYVCLILVLPNIEPIGLTVELPINRTDLITMHIRAMLFEIDTRSNMLRTVYSPSYTLDDVAS